MTTNLPAKTNPLAARLSTSVDALQRLHDHVAKLNNYRWIVESGKLYYVGSRTLADGTIQHFVDRHL